MKNFFTGFLIVLFIVAVIAFFTKPGFQRTYSEVEKALEAANHHVALYVSHDKENKGKVYSSIAIKDMIFYREVFFTEFGQTKKVAIAAFTKIFLIKNPK